MSEDLLVENGNLKNKIKELEDTIHSLQVDNENLEARLQQILELAMI